MHQALQRLGALRRERHLTQQELADLVDVSVVTIKSWEYGARKPTRAHCVALEQALGVPAGTLQPPQRTLTFQHAQHCPECGATLPGILVAAS